ncbi:MAG: elongation factor P [Patescibacteria group bacterium]
MASPNDIKKGTVIKLSSGDLGLVTFFQRVSPGKGGSFVRTKLKNLKTGKSTEETFKSAENLDFEDVQNKKMQYLYTDGNLYTFMDNVSYEQVSLSPDNIGDDVKYLKEGLDVTVIMHNDNPLTLELPMKIQYSVSSTQPAVKGDTASGNVLKDAKLDNGLMVRVPIFIKEGEEILINTENGDYCERVSK